MCLSHAELPVSPGATRPDLPGSRAATETGQLQEPEQRGEKGEKEKREDGDSHELGTKCTHLAAGLHHCALKRMDLQTRLPLTGGKPFWFCASPRE